MINSLLVVAGIALLAGCVTTKYKSFESATSQIYVGRGGTKEVVDGMEVWDNGEPPRAYSVIGFVEDERPDAPYPMQVMRGEIAKKAREAGGDAVVQVSNQSQITGMVGFSTGNAWGNWRSASAIGTSFAAPTRTNSARFAVIKYVDAAVSAIVQQAPALTPAAVVAPGFRPVLAPQSLLPATTVGVQQPSNVVTIAPPADRGGPDRYNAEEHVRATGCQSTPDIKLVNRVPGMETYAAACSNGASMVIRCEYGNCRAMK